MFNISPGPDQSQYNGREFKVLSSLPLDINGDQLSFRLSAVHYGIMLSMEAVITSPATSLNVTVAVDNQTLIQLKADLSLTKHTESRLIIRQ